MRLDELGVLMRAAELLTALGDTEQQVAARLLEGGHVGQRGNCGACPVANYLISSDLGLYSVAVGDVEATLYPTADLADVVYVDLPDPVRLFIESFDLGRHAELVAADGGGTRA